MTETAIEGRSKLQFVVVATIDSDGSAGDGSTVVFINIPPKVIPPPLKFEKSLYRGAITQTDMTLKFDETIRIADGRFAGVVYSLTDGDYDLFEVTTDGENVEIKLKSSVVLDDIVGRTSLSFSLIASLNDVVDGQSAIVIDIIPPDLIIAPVFEKPLYQGSIADNFDITLEDIKIIEGFNDAIVFTLDGGEKIYFLRFHHKIL